MSLIKPGSYLATVDSHAITETRNGDPQATVKFSLMVDGDPRLITWYGSFKGKAQRHTIKGLLACGLRGDNPGGPLTLGQSVSLVIDIVSDRNDRPVNKVCWVNEPGRAQRSTALPRPSAEGRLAGLENMVKNIRQNMASASPGKIDPALAVGHGEIDVDQDVPF